MEITVTRAILHILDFNAGIALLSERELDLGNGSILAYLTKHLEKVSGDPGGQAGAFHDGSEFRDLLLAYSHGGTDFIAFSAAVAQRFFAAFSRSELPDPADLLVCEAALDGSRVLALLKCANKIGFTHQVENTGGKIGNTIINHYAILPGPAQKLDEYALIGLDTLSVKFGDKKRVVEGEEAFLIPERILQCSSSVSPRSAIRLVNAIAGKVSENHGRSSAAAITKAKSLMVESAETSDYLDPVELGRQVFGDSRLLQEEYLREVQDAGLADAVKVDKAFVEKKGKSHRIKTDTGIEVVFPVDYFENKHYMEFINNPDGTISIQLKNIGKIVNK